MFVDLPGEEWRPVLGYEGRYDVSNLGRVRGWAGRVGKGFAPRTLPEPHIKADQRHRCGYRVVALYSGKGCSRLLYVHRLVAGAFLGPCPAAQEVRHLDGRRTNNHLNNLAYGSAKENASDRRRHGHDRLGEQHHAHRLDPMKVLRIRQMRADGSTWASIAREFGITPRAAFCAGTGVTWAWVTSALADAVVRVNDGRIEVQA